MPIIVKISKHSPANCPLNNDAQKKLNQQVMNQLPVLAKKHNVKVIGSWSVMSEHLLVMVYEAPTFEAFQSFLMEPLIMKWIAAQDSTEYKLAMTSEDSMKMLG